MKKCLLFSLLAIITFGCFQPARGVIDLADFSVSIMANMAVTLCGVSASMLIKDKNRSFLVAGALCAIGPWTGDFILNTFSPHKKKPLLSEKMLSNCLSCTIFLGFMGLLKGCAPTPCNFCASHHSDSDNFFSLACFGPIAGTIGASAIQYWHSKSDLNKAKN